jgi:putative peptide zinc metalloprotease protein
MKRRFLTSVSVLAAILSLAAPAQAADSSAVAVNTRDDSTVFKLMFDITRVMGDTVDSSNAAVAVASCDSCETVAVAIQVVLAMGSPTVVIPENLALAMNIDCQTCQTLADAYQYVYTTGGVVHFTADGNQRIADIRRRLEALRRSNLSIEEIVAQVEQLNNELKQVLLTEVVPAGPPAGTGPASGSADSTTGATPGTSTAPTDTGTGTSTGPSDTGTQTTPTDTGTSTAPSDTGTQTTPTDTGTSTTPTDTGTQTTPTDTGTSTTPSG